MKSRPGLPFVMRGALLLGLTLLIGCSRVVINPITDQDIHLMEAGDTYTSPKSGAFLSDRYIKEVMQARIK